MEVTHYLFGFLYLAVVAVVVLSKPNGAPQESCFYMTPRHIHPHTYRKVFPTRAMGLYNITTSADVYRPDRPIRVTLWGPPFKGFMMVATEEGSKDWPTGVFYSDDGTCKRQSCLSRGDTVTHHNTSYKDSVSVLWYGPENMYSEQIQFMATVVVNLTIYYTDIKSSFLRLDPSLVTPAAGGENAPIQIAMDPWLSGNTAPKKPPPGQGGSVPNNNNNWWQTLGQSAGQSGNTGSATPNRGTNWWQQSNTGNTGTGTQSGWGSANTQTGWGNSGAGTGSGTGWNAYSGSAPTSNTGTSNWATNTRTGSGPAVPPQPTTDSWYQSEGTGSLTPSSNDWQQYGTGSGSQSNAAVSGNSAGAADSYAVAPIVDTATAGTTAKPKPESKSIWSWDARSTTQAPPASALKMLTIPADVGTGGSGTGTGTGTGSTGTGSTGTGSTGAGIGGSAWSVEQLMALLQKLLPSSLGSNTATTTV